MHDLSGSEPIQPRLLGDVSRKECLCRLRGRRPVDLSLPAVNGGVARGAECHQVLLGVVARVAAKFLVMDFQVRHRAARLTSPAVAAQDTLPEGFVRHRTQPQALRFGANRAHDAFSLRPPRNACRCELGRNLKNLVIENSNVSGSSLSRLAPARKSAQIISRQ
jgi:hypothetical protein